MYEKNSSNIITKYPHLGYLTEYQTVVRKDYHLLPNKTVTIGIGSLNNGPLYNGFVGSGMLSATVLETPTKLLSSQKILELFKEISCFEKSDKPRAGILLFLQEWKEFNITRYLRAKYLAEQCKISIKVIIAEESNEPNAQSHILPSSDLSIHSFHPFCLPYLYKISGAMAEDCKDLQEIYDTCNEIIIKNAIFGIVCSIYNKSPECTSNSDKLIKMNFHRGNQHKSISYEKGVILEEIISKMFKTFLVSDLFEKKNSESKKLAMVFSCSDDFPSWETKIIERQMVEYINASKISVEFIVHHSLPHWHKYCGFNVIFWNLPDNPSFINYLKKSTSAYFWAHAPCEVLNRDVKIVFDNSSVQFEGEIILALVDFACKALIACASKIDMLDEVTIPKNTNKCGTRLAAIAEKLQKSIVEKSYKVADSSEIISEVAQTFEENATNDPQAQLYAQLFRITSYNALKYKDHSKTKKWVRSFREAIEQLPTMLHETEVVRVLNMAKETLLDLEQIQEANLMLVLERAVERVQSQTAHKQADVMRHSFESVQSQTTRVRAGVKRRSLESMKNDDPTNKISDYLGLAGSHAIGIWMRGAFEGFKQQYALSCFRASEPDDPKGEIVIRLD